MKHPVGFASILSVALFGCGDLGDATTTEGSSGTLIMALSTTDGPITHRLVDASFEIDGPSSQTVLSKPEDAVLEIVLPVGDYTITLLDGWSMESSDGSRYALVPAVLTGPATQGFVIRDQDSTQVTFSFRAGEDVIAFGNGRLMVEIEVNAPEPNADASIACGTEVCTGAAADACCLAPGFSGSGPVGCLEADACLEGGGVPQLCDGTLDCGGDPCCIKDNAIACSATCDVGAGDIQVCSPDDPVCPPGMVCTVPGSVPFYACVPAP